MKCRLSETSRDCAKRHKTTPQLLTIREKKPVPPAYSTAYLSSDIDKKETGCPVAEIDC